jgi:prefoldin subunit 5
MTGTVTILAAILFFGALPCAAQSPADSGSSPSSSSSAKPAAPASNAPANNTADKKKTKKVWTNDEIGKVNGGISVVGDANAPGSDAKKKPENIKGNDDLRQRQIDNYKNQIAQLQSQIDAIDKRVSQLKNFKAENTGSSGGINPNQGYNMVPLEDQVKQLDEKKKQLLAKIDDVQSDARKNGIDSDDLR